MVKKHSARTLNLPAFIGRPKNVDKPGPYSSPLRDCTQPQGQYWAGRTPPPNGPPNMAAANFVMAEGCGLNGTAVAAVFIDQ